jgi:hypothetical protein
MAARETTSAPFDGKLQRVMRFYGNAWALHMAFGQDPSMLSPPTAFYRPFCPSKPISSTLRPTLDKTRYMNYIATVNRWSNTFNEPSTGHGPTHLNVSHRTSTSKEVFSTSITDSVSHSSSYTLKATKTMTQTYNCYMGSTVE